MADTWGRQIRYGSPPDQPDDHVSPSLTRQGAVDVAMQMSEAIDRREVLGLELRQLTRREQELDRLLRKALVELPRTFGLEA